MNSVEKFDKLLDYLRRLSKVCGADVLNKYYKMNEKTCFVVAVIFLFYIFSAYTIYVGWGDIGMIFKSLSIYGCAIQGMVKLYSAVTYASTLFELHKFLRNLYVINFENPVKHKILEKCLKICRFIYQFVLITHFTTPVLTFLYPIYTQIFLNKKQLILPMLIPGITTETIIGYQIYNCVHSFLILIGVLGIIVSDLFFATLIIHFTVLIEFFKINVADLNKLLASNIEKEDYKIKIQLKLIMDAYDDILTYINKVNNSHKLNCFFEIATNFPCLCILLFLIIVEKWIIGYIIVLILFYKVVLYCTFGTIIEIQNDETTKTIYNSSWHLLSISDQKTIKFMLHRSQSPIELTIGGIANLNMQTCMQLIKSIYSFLMMLLNFINK